MYSPEVQIHFNWDKHNTAHIASHDVTQKEAEEVFHDKKAKRYDDPKHSSVSEIRYLLFGQTRKKRKLVIAFTLRNKKVRVISARPMNRKEVPIYEKKVSIT